MLLAEALCAAHSDNEGEKAKEVSDALQIQDFVQAILEDRDPAVTAEEGRKSIEIVKSIYESARIGGPVRLQGLSAVPQQANYL